MPKANQEVQNLIEVAQFNPKEKTKFLSTIRKELAARNISLDAI